MPDSASLVALCTGALGAAVTAGLVAQTVRRLCRRDARLPTLTEAGFGVFLPPAAVLVLPAVTGAASHSIAPLEAAHEAWHQWATTLHSSPVLHAGLHTANALVLVLLVIAMLRTCFWIAQLQSFESELRHSAGSPGTNSVHLLPSERPLCFTAGWLKPGVYLTTQLAKRLGEAELAVLLAHEFAHLRRRDPLIQTFLQLFYTLVPVPWGQSLLHDWQLAVEGVCDRAAASEVGSRLAVASTLVRVSELQRPGTPVLNLAVGFSGGADDLALRVEALLAGDVAPPPFTDLALGLVSGLASILGGLWLPHAVEFFAHH